MQRRKNKLSPDIKKGRKSGGRYATKAKRGNHANSRTAAHETVALTGRIQGTLRGGAYLLDDAGGADRFIPAEYLHGALDGDRVRAKSVEARFADAPSAEVVAVETRAHTQLVGTVHRDVVTPDERRLPGLTLIYAKGEARVPDGTKVVADITRYAEGTRPMLGRVQEVLGNAGDPGVTVLSVIRRYGIRETFPDNVRAAASRIPQTVTQTDLAGRLDLRDWTTFTIDGAHSKDFDDAVSATRLENGNIELGVHIADVTAYVRASGVLDCEASKRGTSVYFADRVIPMLPEALSNGICSLNEGVDRLTLSCIMEFDSDGSVLRYRIQPSVICSKYRLVYDDVSAMLDEAHAPEDYDGEQIAALRTRYRDVLETLELLQQLQGTLAQARAKRGSIDFDVPESAFTFDDAGHAVGLMRAKRGIADKIIEECMLVCNETVARAMQQAGAPILYRVHGAPDADRMRELNGFLGTLGYAIPHVSQITPNDVRTVLRKAQGTPEEGIVARLLLRSMQKARYSAVCEGHFGLAAKEYCHFTSPIRRYPDLFTHRVIKLWLAGKLTGAKAEQLAAQVKPLALTTSASERTAMEAERAVDDRKRCEYMQSRIGETFCGVVSGVTNYGLYVELPNTAEGLVRLQTLDDDYYVAEPKQYRAVGRSHGRVIRLGDTLEVTVQGVDLAVPTLDFTVQNQYHKQETRGRAPGEKAGKKHDRTGESGVERHGGPTKAKRGGKEHAARKGRKATLTKPKSKA